MQKLISRRGSRIVFMKAKNKLFNIGKGRRYAQHIVVRREKVINKKGAFIAPVPITCYSYSLLDRQVCTKNLVLALGEED